MFNLESFGTEDTDKLHIELDGFKCYAPKETKGDTVECDFDKPVLVEVYHANSAAGKAAKRKRDNRRAALEKNAARRELTDAEKDQLDAIDLDWVSEMVVGWENMLPAYSKTACRSAVEKYPDFSLQILAHCVRTENFRKKS